MARARLSLNRCAGRNATEDPARRPRTLEDNVAFCRVDAVYVAGQPAAGPSTNPTTTVAINHLMIPATPDGPSVFGELRGAGKRLQFTEIQSRQRWTPLA